MTAPTSHRTVRRTIDSPLGPLTLVADDSALVALYLDGQRHRPAEQALGVPAGPEEPVLAEAVRQLGEYFGGARESFDLELRPRGTTFQHVVWARLREIPFGATTTYGAIAADLGAWGGAPTGSARAVGAAVGRNPLSLVVPCHRVVGSDGALTGYAGGLERKVWLLTHEGVIV